MPYNLLQERWIPVRRADDSLDQIAPYEIVPAQDESPPVAFAAVRPDFDGALAQFMIGLLQTTAPPADDEGWGDWWNTPPAPGDLRRASKPFAEAFDLDGPGPRFFQDYDADLDGTVKPAAYLLLETPTDNTLKNNADHFVKDRTENAFSLPVAAQALIALQMNAPSGGKGHRTSLRGGGPMTTLVTADPAREAHRDAPLWRTLWLNVLSARDFEPIDFDPALAFPWLAPTRVSTKGTKMETTVVNAHAHPLQAFWGMPRRIRLRFSGPATCALTGGSVERAVTEFETAPYGANYDGPWDHPLSPHRVEDGGDRAYLTEAHRLGYADWLGFALGSGDLDAQKGRVIRPARAVRQSRNRAADLARDCDGLDALGLWAFGFDTDNMKVRAWKSSRFPFFAADPEEVEEIHEDARRLVGAAEAVASRLNGAIKNALFGTPQKTTKGGIAWSHPQRIADLDKKPGNTHLYKKRLFAETETRLWADTEQAFFDTLLALRDPNADPGQRYELRVQWLRSLQGTALALFDQIAAPDQQHRTDPQAVSLARRDLSGLGKNKAIREMLNITTHPAAHAQT